MAKKKSERRKLKDACETMAKQIAKNRDGYVCQKCHTPVKGSNAHGSQVIPVSHDGRLASDPENIKCLCYHCHLNWWHLHPIEAGEWFTSTFPERWEYLSEQKRINHKLGSIPISWYRERKEWLKKLLSIIYILLY